MIVKHFADVKATRFEGEDSQGVLIRPMISDADGAPTFALRYFEIEPGGYTPRHSHDWEHEIFIVAGSGTHHGPAGATPLRPGMALYIPPNEEHQFTNESGDPFVMTCSIPLVPQTLTRA